MRGALAAAFLLFAVTSVLAQEPAVLKQIERELEVLRETRYEVPPGLSLTERAKLLYGGYTSFNVLGTDEQLTGHTRILREWRTNFWADFASRGHRVYGRLRVDYLDFNSGDSFNGGGDGLVNPIGDRYWYRFDSAAHQRSQGNSPDYNLWAQIGRQWVDWAESIVLARTLYSAIVGYERDRLAFTGLFGVTPEHSVDFDGSRPEFDTNTDRRFWGVLAQYRTSGRHRPFIYYLNQDDNNDNVSLGGEEYHYDSQYLAIGSVGQFSGTWHYRGEFVYEFGDSISDPFRALPQTTDDIEAWAARFRVSWIPRSAQLRRLATSFEFEVLVASGDDDRFHSTHTIGGNAPGTNDTSFNAFGFVYTGLVLAPALSNLLSLRLSGSLFPAPGHGTFKRLNVRGDLFFLFPLDEDAPMSVVTIPGESYLGTEFDLRVNWQVYDDFALDMRYGIFIPGGATPYSDARHFFFVGFSYAF